jgi:hypothetical protein
VTAGAVVTALTVLIGALWWLVSPRVVTLLENTCRRAVADAMADLDDRLGRVEEAMGESHSPKRLIELADLLDLIRRHSPDPEATQILTPTALSPQRKRKAR